MINPAYLRNPCVVEHLKWLRIIYSLRYTESKNIKDLAIYRYLDIAVKIGEVDEISLYHEMSDEPGFDHYSFCAAMCHIQTYLIEATKIILDPNSLFQKLHKYVSNDRAGIE